MSFHDRVVALLFVFVPIACVNPTEPESDPNALTSVAGTSGKSGGCGGEAAAGGYTKGGDTWDGTAGNAYGYPSDHVGNDCTGFGFHDGCAFWESCSYVCSADEECPSVENGPAPVCQTKAGTTQQLCVLPCVNDADCPATMRCISHPYGFGDICMWKRTFG
ncbi:MAG: hypothetical protein IPI67_13150 [Myxococcales bacterium]|nr:hypothetical protein [Myxococcales bacterium]